MVDIAPIEYMKWPVGVPIPSYEEIRDTTMACIGLDGKSDRPSVKKTTPYVLARHTIYAVCRYLRKMDCVETSQAMGLSSHSILVDRTNGTGYTIMQTNAGAATVNEVIYCLLRNRLQTVAVERRQQNMKPGEPQQITRKALHNHAGSVVHEPKRVTNAK